MSGKQTREACNGTDWLAYDAMLFDELLRMIGFCKVAAQSLIQAAKYRQGMVATRRGSPQRERLAGCAERTEEAFNLALDEGIGEFETLRKLYNHEKMKEGAK